MRVHWRIEDKDYPNSGTFARDFAMSVRTLKRDVEFMRDNLEMPIEFDVPRNGYFFRTPQPHFPRVPLTEKEMVGLFVAQKTIAQYQGTSLQPVPESAFRKMTAQLKFDLDKELSGSLGVYKGNDDFTVVVDFDAWGADDVRGRRWHSSQEPIELGAGRLRVRLRLNSLEEVERWVLSMGTRATVVRSEKLREWLFKATHELFERYGGPMLLAGRDEG